MAPDQTLPTVSGKRYWPAAARSQDPDYAANEEKEQEFAAASARHAGYMITRLAEQLSPTIEVCENPKPPPSGIKKACVSVILRLVPGGGCASSETSGCQHPLYDSLGLKLRRIIQDARSGQEHKLKVSEGDLQTVGDVLWREAAGLTIEMLLISRSPYRERPAQASSANVKDAQRWSAQVAFPGGKQNEGETDLETAYRECLEETGIRLDTDDFFLLGKLPDRMATTRLSISAFVFVQVTPIEKSQQLQLDPSEVAAAWWVPLRCIADRASVDTLVVDLSLAGSVSKIFRRFVSVFGIKYALFPCVILPPPPEDATTMDLIPQQTTLWGLTLGITSDLLDQGNIERAGGQLPTTPKAVREFRLGYSNGQMSYWATWVARILAGLVLWWSSAGVLISGFLVLVVAAVACKFLGPTLGGIPN